MENVGKKSSLTIVLIMAFVFFIYDVSVFAAGESFWLYTNDDEALTGGVSFGFYPSGYSGGFHYGKADRHRFGPHEMLSGEFGAAIYYSDVNTHPDAMWFQKR